MRPRAVLIIRFAEQVSVLTVVAAMRPARWVRFVMITDSVFLGAVTMMDVLRDSFATKTISAPLAVESMMSVHRGRRVWTTVAKRVAVLMPNVRLITFALMGSAKTSAVIPGNAKWGNTVKVCRAIDRVSALMVASRIRTAVTGIFVSIPNALRVVATMMRASEALLVFKMSAVIAALNKTDFVALAIKSAIA